MVVQGLDQHVPEGRALVTAIRALEFHGYRKLAEQLDAEVSEKVGEAYEQLAQAHANIDQLLAEAKRNGH